MLEGLAPQLFVDFCIQRKVEQVEVGVYKYSPQSVTDRRRVYRVRPSELATFLRKRARQLDVGEDIAIHSRVMSDGGTRIRHVPMIDLAEGLQSVDEKQFISLATDFGATRLSVFSTGRSFHVYVYKLLTTEQWVTFMGRCLLLNERGMPEIVDARWIGHRLIAGYSSLRWTKNNEWYRSIPILHAGHDLFCRSRLRSGKNITRPIAVQPWLFGR